jgi:hypothetical protein
MYYGISLLSHEPDPDLPPLYLTHVKSNYSVTLFPPTKCHVQDKFLDVTIPCTETIHRILNKLRQTGLFIDKSQLKTLSSH